MVKIFVYGTLKVGRSNAARFNKVRKEVLPAKTRGEMYSMRSLFPAVIHGDDTVLGELHTYEDGEEVIEIMDRIEGYKGPNYPNNLYNRENIEVELEDGKVVKAIAYIFNQDVNHLQKVADGEW